MNFAPSWRMRAKCAELTSKRLAPAPPWDDGNKQLGSPAELFGAPVQLIEPEYPLHSGWVKILKASARNSNAMLSLIAKCLKSAMSKLTRPGLRRKFLPASPKVSPVGRANA